MDKRILQLLDANGYPVREIDISDVDHANSTWNMSVVIMTRCDMGHWHQDSSVDIPPWGQRVSTR